MKDQILLELGVISDEMLTELTGYTELTRESHRKHNKLPYTMFGKQYVYPIAQLRADLQAKLEKKYGKKDQAQEIL